MPCSALREVSAYGWPFSGVSISPRRTSMSRPDACTIRLSPSKTRFTVPVIDGGAAQALKLASSSRAATVAGTRELSGRKDCGAFPHARHDRLQGLVGRYAEGRDHVRLAIALGDGLGGGEEAG